MSKVIQLCACLDTVYALTEDGCIYRSEDDCEKAIKERERRAVEGMATLIRCELATKLEDLSKLNANQFIDYFLQLWESEREKENAK